MQILAFHALVEPVKKLRRHVNMRRNIATICLLLALQRRGVEGRDDRAFIWVILYRSIDAYIDLLSLASIKFDHRYLGRWRTTMLTR